MKLGEEGCVGDVEKYSPLLLSLHLSSPPVIGSGP